MAGFRRQAEQGHEDDEPFAHRPVKAISETTSIELKSLSSMPGTFGSNEIRPQHSSSSWLSRWRHKQHISYTEQGWKPLSLTTPTLVCIALLSLVIAAIIEALAQKSQKQGGLALSPTLDDVPRYAMLGYLYGPNIVAVLYSLVWSWVDLDVKRMQPWFALSRPEGALAEDSLFLDYPYDFIAFVPWKAFRRRHWPVFFAGTTTVLIFWLITPLQSATLGTGVVAQTKTVDITHRSQLLPLSNQSGVLDPAFLNVGYAVAWLEQPMPAFTTSHYAALPFYVDTGAGQAPPTAKLTNYTATTTKYSTELDCWPAESSRDGPRASTVFFFGDGQTCNTSVSLTPWGNYSMFYVGYYSSPYSSFHLYGPDCPGTTENKHRFLAIWSNTIRGGWSREPLFNTTALYCQAQYYKQQVRVSVRASDLTPVPESMEPVSPRQTLMPTEFNTTAFEHLLANGMTDVIKTRDVPFDHVIEQTPRLADMNLTRPASNMVGYAVGGHKLPTEDYSDPKVLQAAYNRAHQYLFPLAIRQVLVNETSFEERSATSSFYMHGIIVSRVWSAVVEGLLVFVAFLTSCLVYCSIKAPSNLQSNPSSISRLVHLVRRNPKIMAAFQGMDNADDKALRDAFQGAKFRLARGDSGSHDEATLEIVEAGETANWSTGSKLPREGFYDPIRPTALKRMSGFALVLILIGAVVVIAYFNRVAAQENGLRRPTQNFEVLQLIENYIPTIFATFIEPFWMLLNRFLCVLQPYKTLWAGQAAPSRSLDTTYTAIPPQLALWRAFKSRHFLLVMLCVISLSANVLSVGLGALLNENQATATYAQQFQPLLAPRFDNYSIFNFGDHLQDIIIRDASYRDHLQVTMANLTARAPLPPWTSEEFFFQPHITASPVQNSSDSTYRIVTRGFGVNANCTPVAVSRMPVDVNKETGDYTNSSACPDLLETAYWRMRNSGISRSHGQAAAEYCDILSTALAAALPCDRALTMGWARTPHGEDMNGTVDASFVICRPVFQSAMFDLDVDAVGRVLSYNRSSELDTELEYPDSAKHMQAMVDFGNQLLFKGVITWHNDTLSRGWMDYFITVMTGSRAVLDATEPVPDPGELIPVIEHIYRRTFAALMSLNQQLFQDGGLEDRVIGQRIATETRIFMDQPAFVISMTVLGIYIIGAAVFYTHGVVFVLPRMPTTIGSMLAYVAPSRMAKHGVEQRPVGRTSTTVGFGRYIGHDGQVHLGIEMSPHVLRIDPSSLREKKAWESLGLLGWKGRKTRTVTDGTWL